MQSPETVAYTAYIHTTPEALWRAITDPAMTRLYFDFMVGFMSVESGWEPGTRVAYRAHDGQVHLEGWITEVEPPHRLVTSLSLLYDDEVRSEPPSRISWQIIKMDEVCKLTVTYDGSATTTRTAGDVRICMPSILGNLRVLLETARPRLVKAVVFDCRSPAVTGTFWAEALGYVMQGPPPTEEDDFIGIADPHGVGPELGFQRVPEPKQVKNRVHLDLHVADVPTEVDRLLVLGATRASGYAQSQEWAVLQDPEGNEFCVGR